MWPTSTHAGYCAEARLNLGSLRARRSSFSPSLTMPRETSLGLSRRTYPRISVSPGRRSRVRRLGSSSSASWRSTSPGDRDSRSGGESCGTRRSTASSWRHEMHCRRASSLRKMPTFRGISATGRCPVTGPEGITTHVRRPAHVYDRGLARPAHRSAGAFSMSRSVIIPSSRSGELVRRCPAGEAVPPEGAEGAILRVQPHSHLATQPSHGLARSRARWLGTRRWQGARPHRLSVRTRDGREVRASQRNHSTRAEIAEGAVV